MKGEKEAERGTVKSVKPRARKLASPLLMASFTLLQISVIQIQLQVNELLKLLALMSISVHPSTLCPKKRKPPNFEQ